MDDFEEFERNSAGTFEIVSFGCLELSVSSENCILPVRGCPALPEVFAQFAKSEANERSKSEAMV